MPDAVRSQKGRAGVGWRRSAVYSSFQTCSASDIMVTETIVYSLNNLSFVEQHIVSQSTVVRDPVAGGRDVRPEPSIVHQMLDIDAMQ